MDTDLIFVIGIVVAILSLPSIVTAFIDGRAPRAAAVLMVAGALMIGFAVRADPDRYTLRAVPDIFIHVAAGFAH